MANGAGGIPDWVIEQAMVDAGGDYQAAARIVGCSPRTISRRIKAIRSAAAQAVSR